MGSCLRRPLVATLFVCLLLAPLALPAAAEGLRIEEVQASEAMKFPQPGEKILEPRGLPEYAPEGMAFFVETEPNDTAATANALAGSGAVVYGTISPAVDVDYYSFTASAGDRVSIATMTQFSNGGSTDTIVTLYASDGTTVLETDDDSGSFAGTASAISGTVIPAAGTYYILVDGFSTTSTINPYHLHVKVASGSSTPEVEPNNDPATATPLPASGWASGTITATTDPDFFSFALNAGDSVYLALDMDPDRAAANTNWNGRLGLGIFNNNILVANDSSTTKPHAEAFFFTVQTAGTYYAYVDSTSATGLGANARYHLHVRVIPARVQTDCTLITSTNVPVAIGPGVGTVTSTISVPGTVTSSINDVKVRLGLDHAVMADLDVALVAPSTTSVPLFTDIGSSATGGQTLMNVVLDENAALPIGMFTVVAGMVHQPEQPGRLAAFNGQAAGGTWTLQLADDTTNASGGTLNAWSLEICGAPPPAYAVTLTKTVGLVPGVCATTSSLLAPPGATVYYCYRVSNTGLNPLTSHDLVDDQLGGIFSGFGYTLNPGASIDTVALGLSIPAVVSGTVTNTATWTGRSGANNASATATATVTVPTFCGEGFREVTLAHSDFSGAFPPAGWTVANTSTGCTAPGVPEWTNTNPGARANLTGGAGAFAIADSDRCGSGSTLDTTLTTPALDMTGLTDPRVHFQTDYDDISTGGDRALLEVSTDGGATWAPDLTWDEDHRGPLTILEPIPGAGASGVQVRWHYENATYDWWWMVDNAMVLACEEIVLDADLAITKTNGVGSSVPGTNTAYTIVASNAGPNPVAGATVADTFPAACTSVTWTCVGAGGGTCAAAGTGNINDATVNLPVGAAVTYTATCAISPAATGTLVNTATVTSALADPTPSNNSATDTDTLTPQADLAITKTDGLASAVVGQQITYTIVASNPGPSHAPASTLNDSFPAGLTGVTWTCVGSGGGACTAAGSGSLGEFVDLPAGGSVAFTATGTVGAMIGNLSNTAGVFAPPGVADPNPGNNLATDVTAITSPADVTGTKTASGAFSPGGAVTYTVVLTNASSSPQLDNPGDEFTDTLPAGVTFGSVSATSGTAAFAGGVVTWNGSIPGGGSVTITIDVTIDAGTLGQTITNQGTISYDADGNGTNESTRDTDDPGLPGGADPTSFTVLGSVLEIPTLSALGLAALALALAALALALLRRRQAA